jgi:hypothetical protein
MSFYFTRRNARRKAGAEDWTVQGKTEEEVAEMGDENPGYEFTI